MTTVFSYSQVNQVGVRLEQVSYPTNDSNTDTKNAFSQFSLNWKTNKEQKDARLLIDTGINRYDNFLDLKPIEFYYRYDLNQNLNFNFGQKKTLYSLADEKWFLGLWQPVYQRDLLNPEIMGTVGAHADFQATNFTIHFSYLPFFLPNINPEKSSQDNQIKSQGRWFRPLSQEIDFVGKKTDVRYSVGNIKSEEFFLQNSILLNTSLKFADENLKISASAATKPMNEPQFKYFGKYVLSQDKDFFQAEVSPIVIRHQIYNLDITSKWSRSFMSYVSFGADFPEIKNMSSKNDIGFQAQQQPKSLRYEAFGFVYNNFDFCYLCEFDISYLQVKSDKVFDFDPNGRQVGSILPNRTLYNQAVKVSAVLRNQFLGFIQNMNLAWIQDIKLKGQIFKFANKISLTKSLNFDIGFDILGVDEVNIENENSFFNQFRANDRYFVGMSYVF